MKVIVFRAADSNDIENLKWVKPALTDELFGSRLKKQADDKAIFLLLEVESKVIGFVLLKWIGKYSHPEYPDMEDLFIKEAYRSLGWGEVLVRESERRAKKRGFKKLGLAVNQTENPRAVKFYQRLGYKHDGGEKYLDGIYDGMEDWVIDMEKEL